MLATLVSTVLTAVVVASPLPEALSTPDPLAYDDPGIHFRAPDGWRRIELSEAPASNDGRRPPAAVFVRDAGKTDQRTIVIDIQPYGGTLDGFERSRESELRSQTDGTFVDHQTKLTLANGMPAYLLQVSQPAGTAGHQLRRHDLLVYDLQRSIDVAYIGRFGDFDETEVKAALASLTVVVYPRRR